MSHELSERLSKKSEVTQKLSVRLSSELVHLLSDQLYQSPMKAIEELVVNSYDAEASECRIFVPAPSDHPVVVVWDDGMGMDQQGMTDLWHIGRSKKRTDEYERRTKRKQIGKFGIGKLATYAVANRITYISRQELGDVFTVTLDFRDFQRDPEGGEQPVYLELRRIELKTLAADQEFKKIADLVGSPDFVGTKSWTMSVLEDLKPKAGSLRSGRLRWVLSSAMPLRDDFVLTLNGVPVQSSKAAADVLVSFDLSDMSAARLKSLAEKTDEQWTVANGALSSPSFPSGLRGTAIVTRESLHTGKSADLGRSHGFFVRVRERLINESNALFDLDPLAYQTFNRFRADVFADDLDAELKAPREGMEESPSKRKLQAVLSEVYYEARSRYEKKQAEIDTAAEGKNEKERNYVNPRLVERPIADVLLTDKNATVGGEADSSWFYLALDPSIDVKVVATSLYTSPRSRYTYSETNAGESARMVSFNPMEATFYINRDHDLVRAHANNPGANVLLQDMATAEVLLEVYLREHEISPAVIGEILERRDTLLRSLAHDHPYSLESVRRALLNATDDEGPLEIAVVAALRALGFVATHISNGGEPDGVARFIDYPTGEFLLTLEAKSSAGIPSLGAIDFAGLREHADDYKAHGCLLVAPGYPGGTKKVRSAASKRAVASRISCWTVDQLARIVGAAENRLSMISLISPC